MPRDWIDYGTLAIAVAALLLSSWNAWTAYRNDRVKLKVTAKAAKADNGRGLALLEAHNGGRRAITLVAAGFELEDGTSKSITNEQGVRQLPRLLSEADNVSVWDELDAVSQWEGSSQRRVVFGWFRDAGGRKHRTSTLPPKWLTGTR